MMGSNSTKFLSLSCQCQSRGTQTDYEFPLGSVTEKWRICKLGQEVLLCGDNKHGHWSSNYDKNVLLGNNEIFIDSNRTFNMFPNLCISHLKRAGSLAGMASSLNFRSAKITSSVWLGDFPHSSCLKEEACSTVNSYGNCLLWMGLVRMGWGRPSYSGFLPRWKFNAKGFLVM